MSVGARDIEAPAPERYPHEPPIRWSREALDGLLGWAYEREASDVALHPGDGVWIRLQGAWRQATARRLVSGEIAALIDQMAESTAASGRVMGEAPLEFDYEVRVDRATRRRWRCSATACRDAASVGYALVLRAIPPAPPTLEALGVEPGLARAAFPESGLVLVTGTMGSGKTTLLAALLRHVLEHEPRHVLTYEDPIEYDLASVPARRGPLAQAQIGTHLAAFAEAPRNAARRAADVILVGEARERETLRRTMEAAELGVAAYATVHTRSVAETPARIINTFDPAEQAQAAATLIASLRLVVQQRLVMGVDGRRTALREWLAFGPRLRERLYGVAVSELVPALEREVREHGRPLSRAAADALRAGRIDEATCRRVVAEPGLGGEEPGQEAGDVA